MEATFVQSESCLVIGHEVRYFRASCLPDSERKPSKAIVVDVLGGNWNGFPLVNVVVFGGYETWYLVRKIPLLPDGASMVGAIEEAHCVLALGEDACLTLKEENRMLVLSRRVGERIMVGKDITITLVDIDGSKVRIGIDAPKDIQISREELLRNPGSATRVAPPQAFNSSQHGSTKPKEAGP